MATTKNCRHLKCSARAKLKFILRILAENPSGLVLIQCMTQIWQEIYNSKVAYVPFIYLQAFCNLYTVTSVKIWKTNRKEREKSF